MKLKVVSEWKKSMENFTMLIRNLEVDFNFIFLRNAIMKTLSTVNWFSLSDFSNSRKEETPPSIVIRQKF